MYEVDLGYLTLMNVDELIGWQKSILFILRYIHPYLGSYLWQCNIKQLPKFT
jgi:hypothetical protein